MDQLPRLGKRELICLLLFTCNYVVFVWRGFLFLWVLGMGYVILFWHSLSLPYNYFSLTIFCGRKALFVSDLVGNTEANFFSDTSHINLSHFSSQLPCAFYFCLQRIPQAKVGMDRATDLAISRGMGRGRDRATDLARGRGTGPGDAGSLTVSSVMNLGI